MNRCLRIAVLGCAVAGFGTLMGCEREVAHTKETQIKDDGTVKTKEKTVTESPSGTTVKEEKSTTKP